MKRVSIIGAILIGFFSGCTDEITPITHKAGISLYSYGSPQLHANLQVYMRPTTTDNEDGSYEGDFLWIFGDGQQSTEYNPYHTYTFPGEYTVTLVIAVNGGKKISVDTTVTVHSQLKTWGSPNIRDEGLFLFQNSAHEYILLNSSYNFSTPTTYPLLRLSETFDSLHSKTLQLDWYPQIMDLASDQENLLLTDEDSFRKFDKNGNSLFSVPSGAKRISQTPSGYCLVSNNTDDQVFLNFRNSAGQSVSTSTIDAPVDGLTMTSATFKSPDELSLYYGNDLSGTSNASAAFYKIKTDGQVLFQQDFSNFHPYRRTELSDGAIYPGQYENGGIDDPTLVFKRMNENGDLVWTFEEAIYSYNRQSSIFELDGFIYIFYGRMQGVKINSETGAIVWRKNFSLSSDSFHVAVKNHNGNFVLLGYHTFDYVLNEYTLDEAKRDVLLVEVDTDGQIVD